jgi:hypothetical protein
VVLRQKTSFSTLVNGEGEGNDRWNPEVLEDTSTDIPSSSVGILFDETRMQRGCTNTDERS